MERLLPPRLFFRVPFGLMAGEPVQELDPELCFGVLGFTPGRTRPRMSSQFAFGRLRRWESPASRDSVATGIQRSGVPPPSLAPKKPGGATPMMVKRWRLI